MSFIKGAITINTGIIDSDKHKPFNDMTALNYLQGHQGIISGFLNEKLRREDHTYVLEQLIEFPTFFANLIKMNYELPEEQRIQKIINKILNDGMITVLLGGKRMGKTGASYWLIERLINAKTNKVIYWYGFSPAIKKIYPEIVQTMDIKRIENGVLIYDETMLTFLGRDAMTTESKGKVKLLPTIGHKDMSVIFLSQSTRIDAIILNMANSFWFKPYAAIDFDKERGGHRKLFKLLKFFLPKQKFENTFFDMDTNETFLFANKLPERWCNELSKPFSLIKEKKEAKQYYDMMLKAGLKDKEISIFLNQRGWEMHEVI